MKIKNRWDKDFKTIFLSQLLFKSGLSRRAVPRKKSADVNNAMWPTSQSPRSRTVFDVTNCVLHMTIICQVSVL